MDVRPLSGREGLIAPLPGRFGRPAGVVVLCHHLVALDGRVEVSSPILGLAHRPGRFSHRGDCLLGSPAGENRGAMALMVGAELCTRRTPGSQGRAPWSWRPGTQGRIVMDCVGAAPTGSRAGHRVHWRLVSACPVSGLLTSRD